MPVPSIEILNLLRGAKNSYGWPSLNVDMSILYVADAADVGFLCIFTLMMCIVRSSSNSNLTSGIGVVYMRACKSALRHGPFFVERFLDL